MARITNYHRRAHPAIQRVITTVRYALRQGKEVRLGDERIIAVKLETEMAYVRFEGRPGWVAVGSVDGITAE